MFYEMIRTFKRSKRERERERERNRYTLKALVTDTT